MERLGIETVEDALLDRALAVRNRSVMTPLGDLVPGMVTAVRERWPKHRQANEKQTFHGVGKRVE